MDAQPETGILVELARPLLRFLRNLFVEHAAVARGFGRRGRGVNDRLYDATRAEDGRRPEREDVFGRATLGLVFARDVASARLELADVMFKDARRDGDDARKVGSLRARARLDV